MTASLQVKERSSALIYYILWIHAALLIALEEKKLMKVSCEIRICSAINSKRFISEQIGITGRTFSRPLEDPSLLACQRLLKEQVMETEINNSACI